MCRSRRHHPSGDLDGVSDVRNLGAVARSAECAGAGGIILPAKGGAAINADGVKASAGALLRIGVSKCKNLRIPIYYLKERGFQIVAATEKADGLIYEVDMKKPTAFVMGSEGKGISSSVLALCDVQARIPMHGDIGSLNVSVAASLMLFEAVRQRLTPETDAVCLSIVTTVVEGLIALFDEEISVKTVLCCCELIVFAVDSG